MERNLSDGHGAAESGQLEQLIDGEWEFVDELLKQLARLRPTVATDAQKIADNPQQLVVN